MITGGGSQPSKAGSFHGMMRVPQEYIVNSVIRYHDGSLVRQYSSQGLYQAILYNPVLVVVYAKHSPHIGLLR